MFFAPPAILLELYLPLDALLVLPAPIIDAFTFLAREFYEMFLCHSYDRI